MNKATELNAKAIAYEEASRLLGAAGAQLVLCMPSQANRFISDDEKKMIRDELDRIVMQLGKRADRYRNRMAAIMQNEINERRRIERTFAP